MSEIRLKYSGLVVFASNPLSVATGLAFVLMITRAHSSLHLQKALSDKKRLEAMGKAAKEFVVNNFKWGPLR